MTRRGRGVEWSSFRESLIRPRHSAFRCPDYGAELLRFQAKSPDGKFKVERLMSNVGETKFKVGGLMSNVGRVGGVAGEGCCARRPLRALREDGSDYD